MNATAHFRMADHLTGGRLAAIITDARGEDKSYEDIARLLFADHGVVVTSQTVANWSKRLAAQESEAPAEQSDPAA